MGCSSITCGMNLCKKCTNCFFVEFMNLVPICHSRVGGNPLLSCQRKFDASSLRVPNFLQKNKKLNDVSPVIASLRSNL